MVLTATLGYDPLNRLTSRVNKDDANNTLSSFSYARALDGQITSLTETAKQPDGTSITTTANYTYDALNRLVREQVDTAGTVADYTIDYTLDLLGNRLMTTPPRLAWILLRSNRVLRSAGVALKGRACRNARGVLICCPGAVRHLSHSSRVVAMFASGL